MSRVSIIVPVYNTEEYLTNCINSILNQSIIDLELILVDDGSTDNSGIICDEFSAKDTRVRVIHTENCGQGHARNIGLDLASGDYISFVDSDDEMSPNMYASMVKAAEEYQADLVLCAIEQRYDRPKKINYVSKTDSIIEYDNNSLMQAYVSSNDIGTGPCNKLYKRSLWDDIRFPGLRANEDSYIMHRVLGMCNVAVHLEEAFYWQNVRKGSTEQSFKLDSLNIIKSGEQLICYINEYYPNLYKYVAFEKLKRMVVAQEKIVIDGNYFKYRKLYRNLSKEIKEEYYSVRYKVKEDIDVNNYIKKAVEQPTLFLLDLMIMKTMRRVKLWILKWVDKDD